MTGRSLIVYAHGSPEQSCVNKLLLSSAATLPAVRIHDISTRYPDYRIILQDELTLLAEADKVILQFPLYWYSIPAILKAWLDSVCSAPAVMRKRGLLYGKQMQAITTAGSDLYSTADPPDEISQSLFWPLRKTAYYLGMDWLPPKIMNNVVRLSEAELAGEAIKYREWLLMASREG